MSQDRFGSAHTVAKLDALEKYLDAYTTALRERFTLFYFDAFAGTGDLNIPNAPLLDEVGEASEFAAGSARRSLRTQIPFDHYNFNERDPGKAAELEQLRNEFPARAGRVSITTLDANDAIDEFCNRIRGGRKRAVVFLDPFGSQVDWSSVKKLARTRAVDVWYLFPSGLSVVRQISRQGTTTEEQATSIDRLLGTQEWRQAFVLRAPATQTDLFNQEGAAEVRKATASQITQYVIDRMKTEFAGGVLDAWLPLGRKRAHWYSLLFAWANPSPKARILAKKLALAVLKAR